MNPNAFCFAGVESVSGITVLGKLQNEC